MSATAVPRRALVTGGSGELGGAICHALAAGGYHVIVHANQSLPRAEAVVAAIRAAGGNAQATAFDVTDAEVAHAALDGLLSGGPIHAVINNAGIHDDGPMAGMSAEQWHRVIDVSLHGFFNVTQPLLLPMARVRFGRIVSITSVVGVTGNPGQANYAASKAGLIGMSKSLAQELASRSITVNCVAPGFIRSAMTDALNDQQKAAILGRIPAGDLGQGEDIGAAVAYLASREAGYVTGQTLHVNGGMAMI